MSEPTFKSADAVLTAEPEEKTANNGSKYLILNFANNTRKKDRNTQKWSDGDTTYFVCLIFDTAMMETCFQTLHKGTHCVVEGRLQVSAYVSQKTNEPRVNIRVDYPTISILLRKAKPNNNQPATNNQFSDANADPWGTQGNQPEVTNEPPF